MTETATPTLTQALLAFHADAGGLDLAKNRAAHNSDYLDLDKAMEQIRPLLAKHDLFVRHHVGHTEGQGWHVGTLIVHGPSGESVGSGPFPLAPVKPDAQGWGGALTYGRRYTLMAVLALVADNDDDGASKGRTRSARAASGTINAAQRTELMAAIRGSKVTTERAMEIVKEVAGVEASAEIPAAKFQATLAAIKKEKT